MHGFSAVSEIQYASRFKNYDKEPFGEKKVVGIGGVWAPTERSPGSTPHGIPVQAFGGGGKSNPGEQDWSKNIIMSKRISIQLIFFCHELLHLVNISLITAKISCLNIGFNAYNRLASKPFSTKVT